jgi:hypothetical protein
MDHEVMDEGMDKGMDNDDILADLEENLDELVITPVAEEMKSFYELISCAQLREFFLRDLPYTAKEYDEYSQREEEIFYMVLPNTVKGYEQYCKYVMETRFDMLLILECLAIMSIHIMGEKMKKRDLQHWEAIEDIRIRFLQRLFALYKEWYRF